MKTFNNYNATMQQAIRDAVDCGCDFVSDMLLDVDVREKFGTTFDAVYDQSCQFMQQTLDPKNEDVDLPLTMKQAIQELIYSKVRFCLAR